ncbi:MAG: hypothetical protein GXC94_02085 [Comamonadaceae bacterium]|nr:hypothetical protein [Comamonadaceae bacterium]
MAIVSTATAAKAHDDGRRTANMQTDALKEAAYLQGNDLQRQQSQEASAAADQMNQHAREAAGEMARASVIAGEYGGGATADRGLAVLGVQSGERLATIASNAGRADEQTRFDAYAGTRRAAGQLASIQRPSALGTGLQIGAGLMNAYAAKTSMSKPSQAKPPSVK